MADFDDYADDYDRTLNEGLAIAGDDKDFYAGQRVDWLEHRLVELGSPPRAVLDFGCGVGTNIQPLLKLDSLAHLTGIDISVDSLRRAGDLYSDPRVRFVQQKQFSPAADLDLVFCNGVFHHVPPDERPGLLGIILRSLQRGGYFAFWENNMWNPGTRYLMKKLPFDRDAIPISPPTGKKLLQRAGFEIATVDFLFVFPRQLSALRFIEPWITRLPIGAQYMVLGRKP